jgi:hypothetical protein
MYVTLHLEWKSDGMRSECREYGAESLSPTYSVVVLFIWYCVIMCCCEAIALHLNHRFLIWNWIHSNAMLVEHQQETLIPKSLLGVDSNWTPDSNCEPTLTSCDSAPKPYYLLSNTAGDVWVMLPWYTSYCVLQTVTFVCIITSLFRTQDIHGKCPTYTLRKLKCAIQLLQTHICFHEPPHWWVGTRSFDVKGWTFLVCET